MFDISKVKQNDSEWMDVIHPKTRVKTGAKLLICSPDSSHFRTIKLNQHSKQLEHIRKYGNAIGAEQVIEQNLDLLVDATLDWQGFEDNGIDLTFSKESVKKIYAEHAWLLDQVDTFLGDRRNFFDD